MLVTLYRKDIIKNDEREFDARNMQLQKFVEKYKEFNYYDIGIYSYVSFPDVNFVWNTKMIFFFEDAYPPGKLTVEYIQCLKDVQNRVNVGLKSRELIINDIDCKEMSSEEYSKKYNLPIEIRGNRKTIVDLNIIYVWTFSDEFVGYYIYPGFTMNEIKFFKNFLFLTKGLDITVSEAVDSINRIKALHKENKITYY